MLHSYRFEINFFMRLVIVIKKLKQMIKIEIELIEIEVKVILLIVLRFASLNYAFLRHECINV